MWRVAPFVVARIVMELIVIKRTITFCIHVGLSSYKDTSTLKHHIKTQRSSHDINSFLNLEVCLFIYYFNDFSDITNFQSFSYFLDMAKTDAFPFTIS